MLVMHFPSHAKSIKKKTFKFVKYNDLLVGACNTWEQAEGK